MNEAKKLKGRDLITIGIFSALYFILNLAAMITGFVPVLWLLLPGVAGVLTGIPFMLMESKVQKPGAILIMGLIIAARFSIKYRAEKIPMVIRSLPLSFFASFI